VPIWSHLTRTAREPDIDRPGAVMMDASWRTGALSSVHHGLEDQCEACHVEPFVAVRDQTCLACHKDVATTPRSRARRSPRPPAVVRQRAVGVRHALNKPGPGACTD
jgi:hypothetical protein